MKLKYFTIFPAFILLGGLASCNSNASPTSGKISPEQPSLVAPKVMTPESVESRATSSSEPSAESNVFFQKGSCPFQVPEGNTVECGFVIVPQDHTNPTGTTIQLSIAVFKNQSKDHPPDPLMLLCGGPGEKCLENAPNYAALLAPILLGRDFIVFDQRGVGLSEPALECPEVVQTAMDLLDEPEPVIALQTNFKSLMACHDRLMNQQYNLAAYNTSQNAADVNAIRIALGYDQVNLYGGSYGSLLAQAVMRDHPEGIRSVVLESVWPLEKSFIVDTTSTVPQAILHLLEACALDEPCNTAFPNLKEVLFEVIDRLDAQPVAITITNPQDGQKYPAILNGNAVLGNLKAALYQTQLIPVIPQAIYDVSNGDYALMIQLTSLKLMFLDAVSIGMQYSTICSDDLIGRSPQEVLKAMAEFPRQLVGSIKPEVWMKYSAFVTCENWLTEIVDPNIKKPLISDIPTLVLSGEYDPVTPPGFGRLVASYLTNSQFYMLPGTGHIGESTQACALRLTAAFLDDPMADLDSSCITDMPNLVFSVPTPTTDIVLEAYTDQPRGFSGLVPAGWQEIAPANLARGNSLLDPAYFVLEAAPISAAELFAGVTGQLGANPGMEPIQSTKLGSFTWDFYTFECQGNPVDLALSEANGKAYFVLLISPIDEHQLLFEQIFLPAIEAMTPLE
jgi:pimeloyl-ACP methyl ester carboxylesterase